MRSISIMQQLETFVPVQLLNSSKYKIQWVTLSSIALMAIVSSGTAARAEVPAALKKVYEINLGWVNFTRPWTKQLVSRYLSQSEGSDRQETNLLHVFEVPQESKKTPNPFNVTDDDFNTGTFLNLDGVVGKYPKAGATDLEWFADQEKKDQLPDIFLIGGHHVISEGFENSPEKKYIFEPSLFESAEKFSDARKYFDHVKIAILWGCNTLTDLEPHKADGESMTPSEIEELYKSSPEGRTKIIGSKGLVNSLEFYKHRLATEYGEGEAHYEYTRNALKERCSSPGPWNCDVTNLERVMPESGLYDGSHRYNEALKMSKLFRKAYLVLGFSSASPNEELRVKILEESVHRAASSLKIKDSEVFLRILKPESTDDQRKGAIQALRTAWEQVSYLRNRGRPSGSVTPALPDVDKGYVMTLHQTHDPQLYSKYRP